MRTITTCLAALLLFFASRAVEAAPVYETSALAELIGSRSVAAGELIVTDIKWDGAAISWDIELLPTNFFRYTYTFTDFGIEGDDGESNGAISHLTLDISDDILDPASAILDAMFGEDLGSLMTIPLGSIDFGDFDGITGVVKFDVGTEGTTVVYQFVSPNRPVYGHVFLKSGPPDARTLRNAGYFDLLSEDVTDFIAVPDTLLVPEPAAITLMLLGLIGLLTLRGMKLRSQRNG